MDASAGMRAAITRPITSSIIAALMSTVPIRDCWREGSGGRVGVNAFPSSLPREVLARGIEASTLACVEPGVRYVIFSVALQDFVTLLSAASVVPRLVEDKAAPAANASSGRYPKPALSNANERAIGNPMPVRAHTMERGRFESRTGRLVDNPPGSHRQY